MQNKVIIGMLLATALASCNSIGDISSLIKKEKTASDTIKTASLEKSDTEIPDYALPTDNTDGKTPDKVKSNSASGKDTKANGVVLAYKAPKVGTVFTWHNNWANLPKVISYKVSDVRKIGPKEYVIFKSTRGFKNQTRAFYDTTNFNLKGYRDAKDRALVTYKPVEQRYRFPMKPGDKWVTSWKSIEHKSKEVTSGGGVVQVVKAETLKLPAGKFHTLKLKMPVQKNAPKGLTHHVWFAPELGITVKEEIGGGSFNWFQMLEKIDYPDASSTES